MGQKIVSRGNLAFLFSLAQVRDDIFDSRVLICAYFVAGQLRIFAGFRVFTAVESSMDLNPIVDIGTLNEEFLTFAGDGRFL